MGIRDLFSSRGKATKIYKRGMEKANQRDHEGAIEDYSLILEMSHAPLDVKAMARLNRALARSSMGDDGVAMRDLTILMSDDSIPANVKTAAQDKIKRINRRIRKDREAAESG